MLSKQKIVNALNTFPFHTICGRENSGTCTIYTMVHCSKTSKDV